MLLWLLYLVLISNFGNREVDFGVFVEFKEFVLWYVRLLGVFVEDLGVWLLEIVILFNYEVFIYFNYVEFLCIWGFIVGCIEVFLILVYLI